MTAPKLLLLPRDPTPAMIAAAEGHWDAPDAYRAMVAQYERDTTPVLLEGQRSAVEMALEIAVAALEEAIGLTAGAYASVDQGRAVMRKARDHIRALVPGTGSAAALSRDAAQAALARDASR